MVSSLVNEAAVVSAHAGGYPKRWGTTAHDVNPWCRIPGSPFSDGLVLMPNSPDSPEVIVEYRPWQFECGADCATFIFNSRTKTAHENRIRVEVEVVDVDTPRVYDSAACALSWSEEGLLKVRFPAEPEAPITLRIKVRFEQLVNRSTYGHVNLRYALACRMTSLAELFDVMGSDKGVAAFAGSGVPHCYALAYEPLFKPLADRAMNVLEIGLDNASKNTGKPKDAPSLRVWRLFFPLATIYGFDINDFSFLQLDDTFTFQGDQGSRESLEQFIADAGTPAFGLLLDDGSHQPSHQQISLAALFPHVEAGGLYVIEDLGWQPGEESPTTLEVLRGFASTGTLDSPFITAEERAYLEGAIAGVEIYRPNDSEFAVVRKTEDA